MKRLLILFLATFTALSPLIAEKVVEPSTKEVELMKEIAGICNQMPTLKLPRPNLSFDRELEDYKKLRKRYQSGRSKLAELNESMLLSTYKIWGKEFSEIIKNADQLISLNDDVVSATPPREAIELMRVIARLLEELNLIAQKLEDQAFDSPQSVPSVKGINDRFNSKCRELKELYADAYTSSYEIEGVPFAQILSNFQSSIQEAEKKISAIKKTMPLPEATELLSEASEAALIGIYKLGNASLSDDDLKMVESDYANFTSKLAEAARLDQRAIAAAPEVLKEKERYLKILQEYKLRKNENDERKKEAQQKKQLAEERDYKRRVDLAKKLGFSKGPTFGILDLIEDAAAGAIELKHINKYLVYPNSRDDFEVQNVSNDLVFYISSARQDYAQIALVREPNELYLEGHDLPSGLFQVLGFQDFDTFRGGSKQIAIVKRVTK